jgi:hypothetical protein
MKGNMKNAVVCQLSADHHVENIGLVDEIYA